jgi:hypothetical protein
VDGGVDLAVAAAVQAVAVGSPAGDRDGCASGHSGELRVAAKAGDVGDFADQFGCGEDPEAVLGQQVGGVVGDQVSEFVVDLVDGARQVADAVDLVASDPGLRGGWGAAQAASDALLPDGAGQRAVGDRKVGPQVVALPAQLVDQPGSGADEPLAMGR